jgi:hypothetical protein
MTQQHSITPPPELVEQWCEQLFGCPDKPEIAAYELVRLGAQWGADQELKACVDWISKQDWTWTSAQLRAARRPQPPSLKEKLTEALYNEDIGTALRLVRQLDD